MAAQHLRLVGRQLELAPSHVDPHVVVGRHQIGVARESETHDVKQRRKTLVWNGDIDVLEVDCIPEVFGGAIKCLLHDQGVLNLHVPKASWSWRTIAHLAAMPISAWRASVRREIDAASPLSSRSAPRRAVRRSR